MAETPWVLVTGSAGRIGQAVMQVLGSAARGFDRVPTPNASDFVVADLSDTAALAKAMTGIKVLVHLAATPDDIEGDIPENLFGPNITGVYNVFEAAKAAGVQRLVLASSGQVVWYQRFNGPYPITAESMPTPRAWYACTKAFLEAAGRSFHEAHGMSVIIARLGWCPRTLAQVQEIRESAYAQDVYLSPDDAGRFFSAAVNAPDTVRFAIVYPTSIPVHQSPYDLDTQRELLGYNPQQQWPTGIEVVKE